MKSDDKKPPVPEIESLNADDLDIEELERRIELAGLTADPMGWICGADCSLCGVDCPQLGCGADCPSLCGVDGCGVDGCGTDGVIQR